MVLEGLTEELQALDLSEPEHLPSNPPGDNRWPREEFDEIPPLSISRIYPKTPMAPPTVPG